MPEFTGFSGSLEKATLQVEQKHNEYCAAAQNAFVQGFVALKNLVHQNARNKGFWDNPRNVGEALALIHAEISEGLEAHRDGNRKSDKISGYTGLEEELADVVIRIMDLAGGLNLDVSGAVVAKMRYNAGRPRLHGKSY